MMVNFTPELGNHAALETEWLRREDLKLIRKGKRNHHKICFKQLRH